MLTKNNICRKKIQSPRDTYGKCKAKKRNQTLGHDLLTRNKISRKKGHPTKGGFKQNKMLEKIQYKITFACTYLKRMHLHNERCFKWTNDKKVSRKKDDTIFFKLKIQDFYNIFLQKNYVDVAQRPLLTLTQSDRKW